MSIADVKPPAYSTSRHHVRNRSTGQLCQPPQGLPSRTGLNRPEIRLADSVPSDDQQNNNVKPPQPNQHRPHKEPSEPDVEAVELSRAPAEPLTELTIFQFSLPTPSGFAFRSISPPAPSSTRDGVASRGFRASLTDS